MGEERLVWWFDRCLGKQLPTRMAELGADVRRYGDLYPDDPAKPDIDWIPEVTARGWVIVTKDKNIRRDAAERNVLLNARARYVCLASANMTGPEQVACFERHWRTLDGVVRTRSVPVLVSLTREDVSWWDGHEWRKVKQKPLR